MSIPLVQKAEKDDINTSIIAIKRNIERINMLLGLSNSEEIDTSEFVKKSDIVDEVALDNMQSVTSNAVYNYLNGSASDGSKIVIKDIEATVSNANSLKYTGLNFTLDEGYIWLLWGSLGWGSYSPSEAVLSISATNVSSSYIIDRNSNNNGGRTVNIFIPYKVTSATTVKTVYLWGKWNGNGNNTARFRAIGIKIS